MSAAVESNAFTQKMARDLGTQGFRVLRVYANDKRPVGLDWPKNATNNVDVLAAQFTAGDFNIGVACGPQPNGINLVVIDVDVRDDGLARWAAMIEEHDIPPTAMHITPSGGLHVFFDAGDLGLSNSKLCPGIDVRGLGGQVVVPPSSRTVNGQQVHYTHKGKGLSLNRHPVAPLPEWLAEALVRPSRVEVQESAARHPSQGGGIVTNADWLADHWNWLEVLVSQGYEVVGRHGEEVYVRHPTATSEKSATVHLDSNHMNAYSTNMPSHLRERQINRDGSLAWSPYDWFTATFHDGDYSAATREINRRRAPLVRTAAGDTAPTDVDATALFPPPEWYQQRPWLAAVQQMAHAVGGSPAAHMLAFLTRWATLIPPGYSIPPINGAPSSFDLLGVIAGTSGAGKTSPMRNAARMLPVQRDDMRMGLGLGSGEGIIEAFYGIEDVEGDDGKKRKERRKMIAGVNFAVSEGLIFTELAGRGGTTHVTRLCDAWSGVALSTANANQDNFRHIEEDQYRLTLVMGIQADMAHQLMNDTAASQGFVGRLLFVWAEEPRAHPRPQPPGMLALPVPSEITIPGTKQAPKRYVPLLLEYPDEVYTEIQNASDQRVGQNVAVEEHHHDLLRCKVAGIVALMDGRVFVSMDDWSIATMIVDCSASVRRHLYAKRAKVVSDRRYKDAEIKGELEQVAETARERRSITEYKSKVIGRLREGPAPFGTDRGLGKLTNGKRRWMVERAVEELVTEGAIRKVGDRYELAP